MASLYFGNVTFNNILIGNQAITQRAIILMWQKLEKC